MGYRHYFYEVNIADCFIVKDLTFEQLKEYCWDAYPKCREEIEEDYLSMHDILNQKEVFEFGKLYWDDTAERIYAKGVPLFDVEETQEAFSDYRPYRMGKEGLLEAINIYKQKIVAYYESLLVDGLDYNPNYTSTEKLKEHAEGKVRAWKMLGVLDLNEERERISTSWEYEHQIFELVRLYKSIDWDKKCLLFYGW